MTKHILITGFCMLLISAFATAQIAEAAPTANILRKQGVVKEDRTDVLDITGIGSSTIYTSNNADNTSRTNAHSLKITVTLLTSGSKENFQIVFFSPDEIIPFVANTYSGVTNIYYPISLYEAIKSKLDQTFAAKKKAQLKITQRVDGFKEAILVL